MLSDPVVTYHRVKRARVRVAVAAAAVYDEAEARISPASRSGNPPEAVRTQWTA